MPVWLWFVLGAALLALLGICAVSVSVVQYLLHQPRDTRANAEAKEIERGNLVPGELAAMPLAEFTVQSFDGLSLRCAWLRSGQETRRAVVLVHGFGSRYEHVLKYAKLYTARGYDALLFDHRHCGESEGRRTTMGYLERHDLMQMVALARADKGEGACVGVHGESMGGARVLLAACMEHPPDFVVADCPYADLTEEAEYDLHALFRLPAWPFIPLASLLMRVCGGFFFSEVSPLHEIEAAGGLPEVPILFVHGTEDALIPCSASEKLYAAKSGKKALLLVKGAGHARSIVCARAEYTRTLYTFLDEFAGGPA